MILLEMPDFINKVEVSKTRKPVYLKPASRIPKKYLTKDFMFSGGVLVNKRTGLPVITNSGSLSKATYLSVNGQHLYNGRLSPFIRNKLIHAVKDFMRPFVKSLPVLISMAPLRIATHLYVPIGVANWDIDNLWLYNKCFQDLLKAEGKLPDDCIDYITAAGGIELYPIDDHEPRKLVYRIESDTRLFTHPYYHTPRSTSTQGVTTSRHGK